MPLVPGPVAVRAPGVARWAAIVVVVVMAVGTVGANRDPSPPGPAWVGALLATGAVLPVLIDVPCAVALLTAGCLSAAYFAAGYADGPLFGAIPAVAFAVAATTPRPHWGWTVVAAVLGVAGLEARARLHSVERPAGWQSIGLVALIAAASAVAAALRSRRVAATERARSVVSEERLRMAADLHDGVGHGLAVIAMQAGAALHVLDKDPASARASLEAIRESSRESLELLRGELARLAGDRSAPRTPTPGISDLAALVERVRSGGLDVRLDMPESEAALPEPVARAAYAVVQEGLTNVLRHAAAAHAVVTLETVSDDLVVTVTDDGHGPAQPGPASGQGIAGMRSRVTQLGGTLEAGRTGSGYMVRAHIPIGASR